MPFLKIILWLVAAVFTGWSLVCGIIGSGLLFDFFGPWKDTPVLGICLYLLGACAALYVAYEETSD